MSTVKVLKFENGERYPVLFSETGLPDFWVTLYVTASLRLSHAATSIENIIRDILHLRLWEELEERELIEEFAKGVFLCPEDIHSLRDHCLIKPKSARENLNVKKSPNVLKINTLEPFKQSSKEVVSKHHYANRISHIAGFLDFIARTVNRAKGNYAESFTMIEAMTKMLCAQKRKVMRSVGNINDHHLKVPVPEVFEQFMGVVEATSVNNPFKTPGIKNRNELMFRILYETGVRSGELLALRITDIDYFNSRIAIVRRHNDVLDLRSRQPVAKTLSRDVYITSQLAQAIRKYIVETRSRIDGANKHPYLFVTHKKGKFSGKPITDASFRNRILKPVIDQFPEDFSSITRHGFRHNFNYLLSQKIDKHNQYVRQNSDLAKNEGMTYITEKEENDIRKRLNGWSSEHTAATYNKRHIIEKTNMLMMSDMNSQMSGVLINDK